MNEPDFHELVAGWLRDSFNDIEHEPRVYYDGGDRYKIPDFLVHTPFKSYVLEVEDEGYDPANPVGQAAVYAELTGFEPVIVVPASDPPGDEVIPDWLRVETV